MMMMMMMMMICLPGVDKLKKQYKSEPINLYYNNYKLLKTESLV